jgi:uncharacterized protein (TIGR00290 family)
MLFNKNYRMKAFMNWSGGKDSALALYHILGDKTFSVDKLLTNINNRYHRISMHGVREELLDQQTASLGIPLQKLFLDDQPSMAEYEKQMSATISRLQEEGFTHSIFGDIFLEDLKLYREGQLAKIGIIATFPLWKRDTRQLIHEFIDLGFKSIVVCINEKYLDKSFCGRIIDESFIADIPSGVDICGENGEFHTFVYDGPIFSNPVAFATGEIVYKKYKAPGQTDDHCFRDPDVKDYGFYFCDLLPA